MANCLSDTTTSSKKIIRYEETFFKKGLAQDWPKSPNFSKKNKQEKGASRENGNNVSEKT